MLERAALLLLLALGSTACSGDDEARTRTVEDIGTVCLAAEADGRLTFSVNLDAAEHCLTSCNINTTTCRVALTDHQIELHSLLEIRDRPGSDICDAACWGSTGTCQLAAPPPGDYEVGFASAVDTTTLPLQTTQALFGDHACVPQDSDVPPADPSF